MEYIILFFVFIFGTSIGSFLNVCIYRIPEGQSVVYPPSACANCGKRLKSIDMIPIVSGLILRGTCRYCGAKFSMRHVLVEFITGFLYILFYIRFGVSNNLILAYCVSSYILVIAFIDIDYGLILNKLIIFGILFFTVVNLILMLINLDINGVEFLAPKFEYLTSGLIESYKYGMIYLVLGLIVHLVFAKVGLIGMGDVKLALVLAMIFEQRAYCIISGGLLFATLFAVVGIILGKKKFNETVKLGPFFALSAIIFLFINR